MFITNLLKFIFEKVYFNIDLPIDRNKKCELKISSLLLELFLPTTKLKKVGMYHIMVYGRRDNLEDNLENQKFGFIRMAGLYLLDLILFIPRFFINILKLITEVLPLLLRELNYTLFKIILHEVNRFLNPPLWTAMVTAGAIFFWLTTSLFSLIYFCGCLLTSPGRTITAILETFNKFGLPVIGAFLSLFFSALVFFFHFSLLILSLGTFYPLILPSILNSGLIGAILASGLILVEVFSGFIFNNDQSNSNFIVGFDEKRSEYDHEDSRLPLGGWKLTTLDPEKTIDDTNVSIAPDEFIKIFKRNYQPLKLDKGNRPLNDEELMRHSNNLIHNYRVNNNQEP